MFAAPINTAFAPATQLYAQFTAYDIVMFGCRGAPTPAPTPAQAAALASFVLAGGWVYLPHFEESWLQAGPAPWPSLATYYPVGMSPPPANTPASIDTTAPSGQVFADWVVAAGASTIPGQIPLVSGRISVQAIDAAQVQRVMYIDPALAGGISDIQSFSWSPPGGGRVTFTDMHLNGLGGPAYPQECGPLDAQAKAIAFEMFDVPGC
jgi:hypothetical protein